MELSKPRRWTLLDAMVLIGVTTGAIAPTLRLAPEIIPVVRMLDSSRLFDRNCLDYLFYSPMRSGRMDSVAMQATAISNPILGIGPNKRTYIDRKTKQRVTDQEGLDNWIQKHSHAGSALGYAISQDLYFLVFPFLILWSLGLLILRMVPPRPEWRSLLRKPGFWASFAPLATFGLALAFEFHDGYPVWSIAVPCSVILVWTGQFLIRRWQPEPTWIDRAGRGLGVLWLATIPVYLAGFALAHLR